MAMFKGFKPQGLQKIANRMGYTGSLEGFDSYLQQNPDKQNMMNMYNQRAMQMAQGGAVRKMAIGGAPKYGPEGTYSLTGMPNFTPPKTQAVGEDDNNPQMPKRVSPATRAYGEDGSGGMPIAKTQMVGEDDNNPQMLKLQERLPSMPATTRALGEDGSGAIPEIKTMAVGEDDGDMGGKFVSTLPGMPSVTEAIGEDGSGGFNPNMVTQRVGEDGNMADAIARPIGLTRAFGEDGSGGLPDGGLFPIDPRQPQPKQTQADVPTLGTGPSQKDIYTPRVDESVPDPYADYRKNVETFPETGTFKNPKIQPSFDDMTKELERNLGNNPSPERLKERSDKVLDYVKNVYSGPLYREDGKTFTEEFKQYAKDSGITINDSFLDVQKDSPIATTPGYLPTAPAAGGPSIGDVTSKLAQTGAIPTGAVTKAELIQREDGQFIDPNTGQLLSPQEVEAAQAGTATADAAQEVTATKMEAVNSAPAIQTAVQANQAAQTDPNDPRAKVTAAQQTTSSVGDLDAAQGNATLMENPVQREIQDGELISGVADAEKAAKFTEQIEAATATPSEKATVKGQLAELTADFDMSNPPPWAAGALRGVQAQLQKRGLGASSVAGQALIQGALESALPIAQADANTQAQFESQNLTNRQQRAMLAAQQRATFIGQEFDQAFQARVQNSARIGDIANMNFTAEQNIAMENSRAVNTMNLQNLSNKQAMVMAEAAALSQLDMANLSNNQQAAVQNAQNFLQMEMANLSNEQQTAMFNAQAINQALLTDQAAQNAASQFNATSENQTKQFMANLANNISQFNATQINAQQQFNAGEENTIARFNAEVRNQRDQFNANNQLQIAQNNAVWRREIATADTAAINRANEINAKAVLDVSNTAYNNLWSFFSDTMEWAWESSESELDRINALAVAEVSKSAQEYASNASKSAAGKTALGSVIGSIFGNVFK